MNEEIIKYIEKRIDANIEILATKSDPATTLMIENAITELEGVLEIAKVVPSRTSKEPNLKDDENG